MSHSYAPRTRGGARWHDEEVRPGRRLLRLTLLALLACRCGGGASDAATGNVRPPTPVRVEPVEARTYTQAIVVPGIVEAKARIELGFRIDGFVERIHVDEADRVAAGDLIAELDRTDLERAVRMAQVELDEARAREAEAKLLFERQQELYAAGNAAQQQFDQARLAYDGAHAAAARAALQLEAADDRLSKGVLRAPVTGYVETRHVEPHEATAAGAPVVTLSEVDPAVVRAAVADTAVAQLRVGAPVTVRAPTVTDGGLPGTIARIAVAADSITRTCPFEVEVANVDLALRPQATVEVEIPLRSDAAVLTVPLAAVLRDASAVPFCFVAVETGDGVGAARRPLVLGPVHNDRITVASGLADGDRVIVRGQYFLGDGDPVQVVGD